MSIPELQKAFQDKQLVLFVGSGISIPSLPAANGVIECVLQALCKKSEHAFAPVFSADPALENNIASKQFEVFLQHIHEILGDEVLTEILRLFFPRVGTSSKIGLTLPHSKLALLFAEKKLDYLITVNFDSNIEIASKNTIEQFVKECEYDANNLKRGIYKLHGSLEEKHIRAGENPIATLFSEGRGLTKNKKRFLRELFKENTIWFIGYSLFDFDMMMFLKELLDEGFPFKGLVFNIFEKCKRGIPDNIKFINQEFIKKGKRDVIKRTPVDCKDDGAAATMLKVVFGNNGADGNTVPFDGTSLKWDTIDINMDQATLLVAKLMHAVGKGDNGDGAVLNPLWDIISRSKDELLKLEVMHQIAQSHSASTYFVNCKIRHFENVCNIAGKMRYQFCNNTFEKMRVDTIWLESLLLELATCQDIRSRSKAIEKKYKRLKKRASDLLEEYRSSQYAHHFEILYYRCLNDRARYFFRTKQISANPSAFEYLRDFSSGNKVVGDLDVNAVAYYLVHLLYPGTNRRFENKARFIQKLLGNKDFKDFDDWRNTLYSEIL